MWHTGMCLSPEWGALSTVLMNADGRAASHPAKLPMKMNILFSGLREAQKDGVTLLMPRRSPMPPLLIGGMMGVGLVLDPITATLLLPQDLQNNCPFS